MLQCTSAYPCPPEQVGLNLIPLFQSRYGCAVGLSDHSGTIYPGLAAATLGAEVLEVHVTLSREMFGPDVTSSVTTAELRQLVEGVRFLERARSHPVDKERPGGGAAAAAPTVHQERRRAGGPGRGHGAAAGAPRGQEAGDGYSGEPVAGAGRASCRATRSRQMT